MVLENLNLSLEKCWKTPGKMHIKSVGALVKLLLRQLFTELDAFMLTLPLEPEVLFCRSDIDSSDLRDLSVKATIETIRLVIHNL